VVPAREAAPAKAAKKKLATVVKKSAAVVKKSAKAAVPAKVAAIGRTARKAAPPVEPVAEGKRRPAGKARAGKTVGTSPGATSPEPEGGSGGGGSRRRGRQAADPIAVNDPLTFVTFVAEHPLRSVVEGTVESFVSHGAMVEVAGMRCYAPLRGLGSPPPTKAREVLERGERRRFVVVALDAPRRGAELALAPDPA
jgi:hypothetical protein